jgi:branched-chain amino acid transport system substrate-binding protein
VGDAAIGMYQSGPSVVGEDYDAFLALWDEEIGGVPPSGFHAHAFDATNILLDAIEAVAVEDADGSVSVGRQAIRDQISSLEGYAGLTGTLTCQDESPYKGDCATGEALAIYELTQDQLDGVWPPEIVWTPADAIETE